MVSDTDGGLVLEIESLLVCLFAPSRFITNGAEWTQTLDMLPTVIILKLAFVGGAVIPVLAPLQNTRTLIATQV